MPFGKCPVLEIDGKMYAQSIGLAAYLAVEYGLAGSSNLDMLEINQLLGLREELQKYEGYAFMEKDTTKKAEFTKDLYEIQFPRYLQYFTKLIEEKSQGKKFFFGDKLSAADLVIYAATTTLHQERPDVLSKYPVVANLRQNVAEVDSIKNYLATRKVTPV